MKCDGTNCVHRPGYNYQLPSTIGQTINFVYCTSIPSLLNTIYSYKTNKDDVVMSYTSLTDCCNCTNNVLSYSYSFLAFALQAPAENSSFGVISGYRVYYCESAGCNNTADCPCLPKNYLGNQTITNTGMSAAASKHQVLDVFYSSFESSCVVRTFVKGPLTGFDPGKRFKRNPQQQDSVTRLSSKTQ